MYSFFDISEIIASLLKPPFVTFHMENWKKLDWTFRKQQ